MVSGKNVTETNRLFFAELGFAEQVSEGKSHQRGRVHFQERLCCQEHLRVRLSCHEQPEGHQGEDVNTRGNGQRDGV